jgi:hypothetical protein
MLFCSLPAALLLLSGCANHQGVEPYHASLTSVGARFGALPSAVQNSIRAQTGAAEIRDIEIDKEMRLAGTVYRITYVSDDLYPPLFVAADGSIINPDMTVAVGATHDEFAIQKGAAAGGLHFNDLPAPVAHVVEQSGHAPDILSIDRQIWGNQVVYIIAFRDELHLATAYIAADGTVLQHGVVR